MAEQWIQEKMPFAQRIWCWVSMAERSTWIASEFQQTFCTKPFPMKKLLYCTKIGRRTTPYALLKPPCLQLLLSLLTSSVYKFKINLVKKAHQHYSTDTGRYINFVGCVEFYPKFLLKKNWFWEVGFGRWYQE